MKIGIWGLFEPGLWTDIEFFINTREAVLRRNAFRNEILAGRAWLVWSGDEQETITPEMIEEGTPPVESALFSLGWQNRRDNALLH